LAGLLTAIVAPTAGAETIADKRRQARKIAAQLDSLQSDAEQLAENYNDAKLQLAQLDVDVNNAQARLSKNQADIAKVHQRMNGWAVRAYVSASQGDPVFALLAGDTGAESLGFEGYSSIAVGKDADLSDELRQRREDVTSAEGDLSNALLLQKNLKADLGKKKKAAETAVSREAALLASTNAELSQLIEEERQRVAAAEAARIKAEIEAQRAARQAQRAADAAAAAGNGNGNSNGGGGGSSAGAASPAPVRVRPTPPPPSPGASGAVEQAKSMLGVPYRWAQDDPASGFDCSGLTSWAWGRAGVSLPHSSRAQFSSLTSIDPADLEPGDLVFFGSPVHHVGMYIGDGQMIHAPHSGAVVSIATIYRRDLRGGGRP
jgi:cell wall-associated NlpC family hydrolase